MYLSEDKLCEPQTRRDLNFDILVKGHYPELTRRKKMFDSHKGFLSTIIVIADQFDEQSTRYNATRQGTRANEGTSVYDSCSTKALFRF